MKRPRRIASSLSESVHHQLNMYALAASAAGVSLLALVQPGEADGMARSEPVQVRTPHLESRRRQCEASGL